MSHPARGAWIETALVEMLKPGLRGRTPLGVRGLKLQGFPYLRRAVASHPARGAWIETSVLSVINAVQGSHPARGAWIETGDKLLARVNSGVAPRSGCVD